MASLRTKGPALVSLRTLAFSWQAGLQVSAYVKNCEERDTVSGDAHLSLALGHPVKMGVRRKGVTVSLPRGSKQRRLEVKQAGLGLTSNSALRQLTVGQ